MLTFFCPNCWHRLTEADKTCPQCGSTLDAFDQSSFEDKLIAALNHPIPENRQMAAQILGRLGCERALPAFEALAADPDQDYFFLREVLVAAARIPAPASMKVLCIALDHPSGLVQREAADLIRAVENHLPLDDWDHCAG